MLCFDFIQLHAEWRGGCR